MRPRLLWQRLFAPSVSAGPGSKIKSGRYWIHFKREVTKQMDKAPRNNAHCTLPDDPEQSTYRFIIVAAKRARQLQGGARPVLPTSSKKPTVISMEEVRRGLVKYSLTAPAP